MLQLIRLLRIKTLDPHAHARLSQAVSTINRWKLFCSKLRLGMASNRREAGFRSCQGIFWYVDELNWRKCSCDANFLRKGIVECKG
jgi:hypothetical protein